MMVTSTFSTFSIVARRALGWWLGELRASLPERLRRRIAAAKSEWVVAPAATGDLCLSIRKGAEMVAVGEGAAEVERLVAARRLSAATIQLPAEIALRSILPLPLAAERNLADAVEFELPRRSPYPPETVYHAFRVVERDRARAQLRVELTIAARAAVDALVARATALGVAPSRVEVAGDEHYPLASPDLRGREASIGSRSWRRGVPGLLAGLAVVLAAATIVVPLVRMQQHIDTLTDVVAAEKREADEALRLEAEIQARSRDAGFLGERKRAAPSPTRTLDALTKLLPDDTWLTAFEMSGDAVAITGSTASASSVIALLDRSGFFAKPSFRSPVTQAPHSVQEQFNIAAEVAGRAAP
ncbi:PilN domain-containing protein [Aliidongia dinghuensis]|nr:PilN domain-containing protein [Aliidongia dinghuensis]